MEQLWENDDRNLDGRKPEQKALKEKLQTMKDNSLYKEFLLTDYNKEKDAAKVKVDKMKQISISGIVDPAKEIEAKVLAFKDTPHNCAQTIHIIPADPNFEKKCNSSALFAREISFVTQPWAI